MQSSAGSRRLVARRVDDWSIGVQVSDGHRRGQTGPGDLCAEHPTVGKPCLAHIPAVDITPEEHDSQCRAAWCQCDERRLRGLTPALGRLVRVPDLRGIDVRQSEPMGRDMLVGCDLFAEFHVEGVPVEHPLRDGGTYTLRQRPIPTSWRGCRGHGRLAGSGTGAGARPVRQPPREEQCAQTHEEERPRGGSRGSSAGHASIIPSSTWSGHDGCAIEPTTMAQTVAHRRSRAGRRSGPEVGDALVDALGLLLPGGDADRGLGDVERVEADHRTRPTVRDDHQRA